MYPAPLPAVLLMGPTASGKSDLALELAARLPVEIVSVDSAQIYLGMDIGTAKPDAATRRSVPHHLIDIEPPTAAYSIARFLSDALAVVAAIRGRNRIPLLVGGTMLYFKALLEGLSALPAADPAVRARIDARAARDGWAALHAELARVDAHTATRLAPTDRQRIQRALEVFMITGRPLSALHGTRAAPAAIQPTVAIALLPGDRVKLHERIAQRFDAMLARGLVDEVADLRARYALTPELPSMRCIGYRQTWRYLDGKLDLAALRATGVAATRQLAKRQFTWLRAIQASALEPDAPDAAARIRGLIAARLPPSA